VLSLDTKLLLSLRSFGRGIALLSKKGTILHMQFHSISIICKTRFVGGGGQYAKVHSTNTYIYIYKMKLVELTWLHAVDTHMWNSALYFPQI
jgi:hypothetical protein